MARQTRNEAHVDDAVVASPRRVGFAVKVLGHGGLPANDARRWQSEPHLGVSLDYLEAILGYLQHAEISMYRLSSSLIPYGTHPGLPQFRGQVAACAERLASIGERARAQGVRLSAHPSQYIVLNSERAEVRTGAIADLELHAELFDALGLGAEAVVVLHIGGLAGGREKAIDRFLAGVEGLSDAARGRLVIENDDRVFGLQDVLEVSARADLRVVWDNLHHRCLDPARIPEREALKLALATWPKGVRAKIHYSSPRTALDEQLRRSGRKVHKRIVLPPLRAHADLIDPIGFEHFLRETAAGFDFDIMLEAKAKDLALLRLRAQMAERGIQLG